MNFISDTINNLVKSGALLFASRIYYNAAQQKYNERYNHILPKNKIPTVLNNNQQINNNSLNSQDMEHLWIDSICDVVLKNKTFKINKKN